MDLFGISVNNSKTHFSSWSIDSTMFFYGKKNHKQEKKTKEISVLSHGFLRFFYLVPKPPISLHLPSKILREILKVLRER